MVRRELLLLKLRFHPVGQGLFTTGCLRSLDKKLDFNWVYDCGTTSSQKLVNAAISSLKLETNDTLDLVTISHFDKDHISGLVQLLSTFKIKTLLLPYMPLWQRLYCAFVEGVDTQDAFMGLFIDPVAYVLALDEGSKIGKIVLVPPSTEAPGLSEPTAEGGEAPETFDFGDPPSDAADFGKGEAKLKWLRPNGKIQINGVWEFVPYNDAKFQPKDVDEFRQAVDAGATILLNQNDDEGRTSALKKLKAIYDQGFGKSAFNRNVISLFLYGGPIGDVCSFTGLSHAAYGPWCAHPFFWDFVHYHDWDRLFWPPQPSDCQRVGFLMTGDGYLDSPERLDALMRYFEPHGRLSKVSALQVMHHGSNKNWHRGVASAISPDHSIFSSDPNHKRYGHPHRDVVEDFICYGPQQVDGRRGFYLHSMLCADK